MGEIAIQVERLGKKYRIGTPQVPYRTLRDGVMGVLTRSLRRFRNSTSPKQNSEILWALKDVSFEIKQGEVLGVIGRNGAGKTTLLKILSHITEPTEGRAILHGRVGSLLEVGTGFHPELTGRENIYLNGAILGMKRNEIKQRFDEIVTFAEVEKFIDTPVKHFSSGMYLRLAFAVAAHLEPEILLVDEVLAVGDAAFQKKCLGKMGDVAQKGRTVLFISHNMQAVRTLCKSALLLTDGRIETQGDVHSVVNTYLSKGLRNIADRVWENFETAPGSEFIKIRSARVIPDTDNQGQVITVKTHFRIEFVFRLTLPEALFYIGFHFRSISGECIFVSASTPKVISQGMYQSTCFVPGEFLNSGTYTLEVYFVRDGQVVLYQASDLLVFEVHEAEREPGSWLGKIPGAVRPKLTWDMTPAPMSGPVGNGSWG
jgi:lipopolysaccharide transport system ATP-binding protein